MRAAWTGSAGAGRGGLQHRLTGFWSVTGTFFPARWWDWWRRGVTVSDGDLISELYAGCFRRLVVQLYAVTGDLTVADTDATETGRIDVLS
jgi:hypothetical protein